MARLDMVFAEQTGRAIEAVDLLVLGVVEAIGTQKPPLADPGDLFLRRIRGVRQLAGILAVDMSGKTIVTTDTDQTFVPPATIQAMLTQYRNDPRAGLIISPPFRGADGKWNALLARPLCAPDGMLAGVVAGSINLGYFEDFYRAVELNEKGAIVLHLRDGTVLARFPHVDKTIGRTFGDLPPFSEVLATAQAGTLLTQSPIDGSTRVTAIRALRAYPLAVMISVDEGQTLADWRRGALALICFAAVLGGAVILLLLSLSWRSRQVERLLEQTHTAHAMAEETKNRLLQQIAERERAEGALRQAQRFDAIGQLTGGVAHDFNNLLTVVLGNVEIMQRRREMDGDGMLTARLSAIRAAAERGATLTGHLLAFARRQPLMPKAIDLNATIEGMRDLLESAVGLHTQTRFQLEPVLWPAMVDQSQVEQVILNLVINARDAMRNGGMITVETKNCYRAEAACSDGAPPGDYVAITVRDTGTGIAPEIRARIFEPFFTTKEPGAGSGLGLSQVFGTAKQLGGEVHVESEVGVGTAVTVDFPRATRLPPPRCGQQPSVKSESSAVRILLVDDNDPVRAATVAMLQDMGYHVRDVESGERALAVLEQDPGIDILLTDLVMSGMNGTQLAAKARACHAGLSIAFISGYADHLGERWVQEDRLIRKPFSSDDLCRMIEGLVADRQVVLTGA